MASGSKCVAIDVNNHARRSSWEVYIRNLLTISKFVGIDVNEINMDVCASMMLGKETFIPTM